MHYVVGSGPAGISCAQALVAAGAEVTILDAGLEIEPERSASMRVLAGSSPAAWTPAATAFLREGISSGTSGIPLKLAAGSDFPYRRPPAATPVQCEGVDTRPSYARGGLSAVWGSAVMPYRESDIAEWPITVADLEPGYRAVLNWMPLAAEADALSGLFPLYRENCTSLPMSRQATAMLGDLHRNRATLNARGVHFGSSRLAVRSSPGPAQPHCVQCGLCMYGCPHELIFSSDQALAALVATGRVHYRPGVIVRSVSETADGVSIDAVDETAGPVRFSGDRVFLAAGVLSTTTILLHSLGLYDKPVRIRDSQYFLLPIVRLRGTPGVAEEPLHTLAQIFVEILDESISPWTIHLQTYTYNDLFRQPVTAMLGSMARFFPVNALLGRLLLFQGYLHSAHSSSISATLDRGTQGDILRLQSVPNPEAQQRVRHLAWKLAKLSTQIGALPALPLLQMGKPGRGFHSGGSFPMSAAPGPGETDTLGRPRGYRRIHAVDATILPSIPATTITFSVMANAWRIGTAALTAESSRA